MNSYGDVRIRQESFSSNTASRVLALKNSMHISAENKVNAFASRVKYAIASASDAMQLNYAFA